MGITRPNCQLLALPRPPVSGLPGIDAPEPPASSRLRGPVWRPSLLPFNGKGRRRAAPKAAAAQPGRNPRGLFPSRGRSGRGAHTWTQLRLPLLPAPGSHRLRWSGLTDPREEVLGRQVPRGKADLTSSLPGCLIFLHSLVFELAVAGARAALGSCKERGCGPCRSTPSSPSWPGGEQHQSMAGGRSKREVTWGALRLPLGPATRGGGAVP